MSSQQDDERKTVIRYTDPDIKVKKVSTQKCGMRNHCDPTF